MERLGVLFSIEELGGGAYGHSAYSRFLDMIDSSLLFDCALYDGDIGGNWDFYCIAIESSDPTKLHRIKSAVFQSDARGLAIRQKRFLDGPAAQNAPLVFAGIIASQGELQRCETWFVHQAWEER